MDVAGKKKFLTSRRRIPDARPEAGGSRVKSERRTERTGYKGTAVPAKRQPRLFLFVPVGQWYEYERAEGKLVRVFSGIT